MKENILKNNIAQATKWSFITELFSKLLLPITNMILARIISPKEFGVVATITMIMSFVDMFTDAGFQKYLIQYEFKSNKDKSESANVAFWTNFGISIILWILIIFFRDLIADIVGNPGLGLVIAIACCQLPLTSFSSIQFALYKREFDFKTLFAVKMMTIIIPFVITIPLAFLGYGYWSIIIGNILTQLVNAVVLTLKSSWKPSLCYSIDILKKMFSFSVWSLIEAISIWLTSWIDTFIISSVLDEYYLGIYKTSISMVNSIMVLITASIVPVLFSSLSRLQNNTDKFNRMYYTTQKNVAIMVLPLGIGIYLFRDLATNILLGSNWSDASDIIGIWGLTSSLLIVFSHFSSEVYRAKGKPRISFLAQLLHLIVLVPVCIYAAQYGFGILFYSRAAIRIQLLVVNIIIMKFIFNISILQTFKNLIPIIISTGIMAIVGYILSSLSSSIIADFISIFICIIVYFTTLYTFNDMKEPINVVLEVIKQKFTNRKQIYIQRKG